MRRTNTRSVSTFGLPCGVLAAAILLVSADPVSAAFQLSPTRIKLVTTPTATQDKVEWDGSVVPGLLDPMVDPAVNDVAFSLSIPDAAGNASVFYKTFIPARGMSTTDGVFFEITDAAKDQTGLEKFTVTKSGSGFTVSLRDRHTALPSTLNYHTVTTEITIGSNSGQGSATLINAGTVWQMN